MKLIAFALAIAALLALYLVMTRSKLGHEGKTFIIVEHNMDLVMSICDHIVVLDRGHPIAEGPPATIRSDPRVLEAYLGV